MSGPFGFLGLNMGSSGPVASGPVPPHGPGPMAGPMGPLSMPPHSLLDPATNNAPLVFNTSKGKPPMPIPVAEDQDYRKMDGEGGIVNVSPSIASPEDRAIPSTPGMVGGMMGIPPMGFGPMMGPMGQGDPSMVMMGPMGINQFGQFMGAGVGPGMNMPPEMAPKEIIQNESCTLYPPPPGAKPPSTRERPPGCRTVFVGGLPETCNEEILRETFDKCGPICSVRYSKKNFAHIRYDEQESVDKAIYLSGYRMKIGNNEDKANTGRLHVDFAQARDDLYEWECNQRALHREQRHRIRMEEERLRPPSPPPVSHFSDHEATFVLEKLKGNDTFMNAAQLLITWLERGDCNRRTANIFYSMVQCTNSHVRRLITDRAQYDEDLRIVKEQFKQRLQGIIHQFEQIDNVFTAASKQRAWDHFTKAQRKNIEIWRKQEKEIKNLQQQEFLKERHEDEMEMSDNEDITMETQSQPAPKKFKVDQDISVASQQWQILREENDTLKCQLEAYKNEVELIKAERVYNSISNNSTQEVEVYRKKIDDKDKQMKVLQQTLQGMQQQLLSLREQLQDQQKKLLSEEKTESKNDSSKEKETDDKSEKSSSGNSTDPLLAVPSIQFIEKIDERQARLIGVVATFLHVHPFGASIEYICSYLQRLNLAIRTSEMEEMMESLPAVFKQNLHGVGASLEKRWIFTGFENNEST